MRQTDLPMAHKPTVAMVLQVSAHDNRSVCTAYLTLPACNMARREGSSHLATQDGHSSVMVHH